MSVEVYCVVEPCRRSDDAGTVVLSNSLGATHEMWEPQVRALAERFRVVRYDTRGHGRSPVPDGPYSIDDLADDLVVLLDRLDIERAHLVGLSLGGMTCLRVAARNSSRVDRLGLLCTSALLSPSSSWQQRARSVRTSGTSAIAEAVVERWYTAEFRIAWPGRVAAAAEMISATPAEGYAGCCDAIARMDLTLDLSRISAPTLCLAGADDPATPPAHLELIAAGVQNGRCLVVPNAAHLANDEQPGIVNAALLEHLGN